MFSHTRLIGAIDSYEIELRSKSRLAENTFAFDFAKPPGFHYMAGQHAKLTVSRGSADKGDRSSRFFSFASAAHEDRLTFAMRMSGSDFKQAMASMQVGDKMRMQVRRGSHRNSFTWSDHADGNRPAVFVVGGIGVVPALSMIKDAIQRHASIPIYLFYSNRRPEDAAWLGDLKQMASQSRNLIFVPTMTRAAASTHRWEGETGYVSRQMIETYVRQPDRPIYYIAGRSDMVAATRELVLSLGVDKRDIRVEDFDGSKMGRLASPRHQRKLRTSLKIAGLGLLLVAGAAAHLAAVLPWIRGANGSSALETHAPYLMIGLVLAAIGIKLGLVLRRRHNRS